MKEFGFTAIRRSTKSLPKSWHWEVVAQDVTGPCKRNVFPWGSPWDVVLHHGECLAMSEDMFECCAHGKNPAPGIWWTEARDAAFDFIPTQELFSLPPVLCWLLMGKAQCNTVPWSICMHGDTWRQAEQGSGESKVWGKQHRSDLQGTV